MRDYSSSEIRNIAVVGALCSGKTSLIESFVKYTNSGERFITKDGERFIDVYPEEIKKGMTIYNSIVPIEYLGHKLNFIDTPGYVDFIGEYESAVSIAEGAIIVVDGKEPVTGGFVKVLKDLSYRKCPSLLFINKVDNDEFNFNNVYTKLRETVGKSVVPFEIPLIEFGKVYASINVLSEKLWYYDKAYGATDNFQSVPSEYQELVQKYREEIIETIAMTNDDLMEKYFNGESFTSEELREGLSAGIANGEIHPLYSGSAIHGTGIERVLTLVDENFPVYADGKKYVVRDLENNRLVELKREESEKTVLQVYKTIIDPYAGKMSFVKVLSGVVSAESMLMNSTTKNMVKLGQLFVVRGRHQLAVGKLFAGDIGVITKLEDTRTNDTLCDRSVLYANDPIKFSKPMYCKCVAPKTKNDEDKLNSSLQKIVEEDFTVKVEYNDETRQTLIYTIGDQHLDVVLMKMLQKYKVNVDTTTPSIAYRETINKKVIGEGRHKKQSGGHGQFGHVYIEFEPNDECEGLEFCQKVVGGAIPKNYFPAIETGLLESMEAGTLGGYKVVNVKATLFDGKYHDVDSSEMAFKLASRLAFKDGMQKTKVVLLEPYVKVVVKTYDEFTGAIIGDLNKRRGIIEGMELIDDIQIIIAKVPLSEMLEYTMDLRKISHGLAYYEQEVCEYLPVPHQFIDSIIKVV